MAARTDPGQGEERGRQGEEGVSGLLPASSEDVRPDAATSPRVDAGPDAVPIGVDGAPLRLGPYDVTGRWHAEPAGQVLSARGPAGDVEIVVLGAGPMLDAAARDRFAAAVEAQARARPEQVLDADPHGPVPWAALRPGSGPTGARPLLDAPLPASSVGPFGPPQRGPSYQPYWASVPASYPQPASAPPTAARRSLRWWWGALGVTLLLLLLLLAACWPRVDDSADVPASTPSPADGPSEPAPPSAPPTPTPSPSAPSGPGGTPPPESRAGAPTQPLQEGPGVSGFSFGPDDATVEMRLPGVPFPFRVPEGWECTPADPAIEGAVRWACTDVTWTGAGPAPGGVVEVAACGPPCSSDTWDILRFGSTEDFGWRRVDVSTLISEDPSGAFDEQGRARIQLSRVYPAAGDGVLDTHVYLDLTCPPEGFPDVQAVANDVRANTP